MYRKSTGNLTPYRKDDKEISREKKADSIDTYNTNKVDEEVEKEKKKDINLTDGSEEDA